MKCLKGVLKSSEEKGHLEIVRLLLEAGADKEATTKKGCTALYRAAQNGRLGVARLLLDFGCSHMASKKLDGSSTHLSIFAGCFYRGLQNFSNFLLGLQEQPRKGTTPFQVAASVGHKEVARLLREAQTAGHGHESRRWKRSRPRPRWRSNANAAQRDGWNG